MRLLVLTSEFPPGPGGIGTHAYHLVQCLLDMDWHVQVVAHQDYVSQSLIDNFNGSQTFDIIQLRRTANFITEAHYRWKIVSRVLTEWHPHIVMASGSRMVWLAAVLAKRYGFPWVAIGHGTEFGPNPYQTITRWAFLQATSVICVSNYTRNYMFRMGIQASNVRVIPNGADAARFHILSQSEIQTFRDQHNLPDANILLTVGNVTERKGQEIVIRALPEIREHFPQTHYVCVGLPTMQAEYSQLAEELGMESSVHFVGRVENEQLVLYLNICDIFVMTSRHTSLGDFEGYGIAAVEAALCGKPCVVSANSGLVEAIVDGETGLVVKENNPEASAQAIIRLLQNTKERQKMGHLAKERALAEQTWSQRAISYNHFFRDLLAKLDKT